MAGEHSRDHIDYRATDSCERNQSTSPNFTRRVIGMVFTMNTLIALIVMNLAWIVYKLVG